MPNFFFPLDRFLYGVSTFCRVLYQLLLPSTTERIFQKVEFAWPTTQRPLTLWSFTATTHTHWYIGLEAYHTLIYTWNSCQCKMTACVDWPTPWGLLGYHSTSLGARFCPHLVRAFGSQRPRNCCQKVKGWILLGSAFDNNLPSLHRLKEHVDDPDKLPILIFPEGTCINNTSVMQFKKGSFEVGSVIYPVAIKVICFLTKPYQHLMKDCHVSFSVWCSVHGRLLEFQPVFYDPIPLHDDVFLGIGLWRVVLTAHEPPARGKRHRFRQSRQSRHRQTGWPCRSCLVSHLSNIISQCAGFYKNGDLTRPWYLGMGLWNEWMPKKNGNRNNKKSSARGWKWSKSIESFRDAQTKSRRWPKPVRLTFLFCLSFPFLKAFVLMGIWCAENRVPEI